jgi:hypothetical protein
VKRGPPDKDHERREVIVMLFAAPSVLPLRLILARFSLISCRVQNKDRRYPRAPHSCQNDLWSWGEGDRRNEKFFKETIDYIRYAPLHSF